MSILSPERGRATVAADGVRQPAGRGRRTPRTRPAATPARRDRLLVRRARRARCRAAIPRSATSCSAARDRSARLEQLGRRRHAHGQRQAAARQRPASRHATCPRPGTSRTCRRGDFEVIGATLPGTPAVALGRNRFIAWGATNVAADVEDLYRERLDATGQHRRVPRRAGAADDHPGNDPRQRRRRRSQLDVRITRHGPLVSDAINANNARSRPPSPKPPPLEPLAFRWTALDDDDTTIAAFLQAERGAQLERVHRRAPRLRRRRHRTSSTPTSTATSATTRPGRIPIRARGDGSLPADGWTGDAEWTGWIPFDELPHALRSARALHRHRQSPAGAAGYPHHARRSTSRSRTARSGSPSCCADRRDADAGRLRAHPGRHGVAAREDAAAAASRARASGRRGRQQQARRRCCSSGTATPRGDSAAAAIFEAWFLQLAPALVGDDLGPLATDRYAEPLLASSPGFVVQHARPANDSRVVRRSCTTGASETCDDAVTDRAARRGGAI